MKNTNISLLSSRALLLTATLALSSTLISKPAFAGSATADLSVSANVTNNCSISTVGVSFLDYDPTNTTGTLADGTISTTCTTGASATITLVV